MTDAIWVAVVIGMAGGFVPSFTGEAASWEECAQLVNQRAVAAAHICASEGALPPGVTIQCRAESVRQYNAFCISPSGEIWRIVYGAAGIRE